MKVYIAGPMTGIPAFNIPAFDSVATNLRKRMYEVVSPAELDDPEFRASCLASRQGVLRDIPAHMRQTWGDLLARDVKLIADGDIDAIVVLPGWEKSRGARLETFVGRLCGIPIFRYDPIKPLLTVSLSALNTAHGVPSNQPLQQAAADEVAEAFKPMELVVPKGEVRVTNATTGGEKGAKPQAMSLLPWDVLMRDVAPLYAAGAKKYARDNWRRGYDWSLSFDALGRHLAQFHGGEWTDPETGSPHLASVVFHACALMYFHRAHPELNDIHPGPERKAA